jgi:hypothetical protein
VSALSYAYPNNPGADLVPGARAICGECIEYRILIAKCGEINRWHWAHESGGNICSGSDGEGAWHRAWKQWAANHGATVEWVTNPHRADIVWPDGRIYELQSDYLDATSIRAREDHYGDRLTWIYRITAGRFERLSNIGGGWFRWNRPAPSMAMHTAPVIWHLNDRLYRTTIKFAGDEVHVRFASGEPDKYGPVLYGSEPAPFDVADAVTALNQYDYDSKAA